MEYLGQILGLCNNNRPRTGLPNCDIEPGAIVALLYTPGNAVFPMDETFAETLEAYLYGTGSQYIIPIKNITDDPLTGGDANTQDKGTRGGSVTIGENQTLISYQIDGGSCFVKELYKFEGMTGRFFLVDSKGICWGTAIQQGGKTMWRGFAATDIFPREIPANGTTPFGVYLDVRFSMNYREEKKNRAGLYIGLSAVPDGLIGVTLQAGTAGTAKVVTACGGDDVTAEWGSSWAATMFVTESGTEATTVSYDDTTKLLSIAPAGSYRIAEASVLKAGEITGLDGAETFTTITSA